MFLFDFALGGSSPLYAISYRLILGTTVHRAISAKAALEALNLIQGGGGTVVKIVVTRTGDEISIKELRQLADDEA